MTEMSKTDTPELLHYVLFTGEILFTLKDPDSPDGVHSRVINALIKLDVDHISLDCIGQAQQAMQANLFSQLGKEMEVKVHDVVITNHVDMGWMTAEQFDPPKDKVEVKEKPHLTPVN